MKYIKKILSIIVVLLLLLNCAPLSYASKKNNILTINGNLYDWITDVEYGWDGKTYRFNDGILNGIKNDDEVYLIADVKTNDQLTVGSSVNIELYNFRLEGADKQNYLSPVISNQDPINKVISINKKTISISPEHPYIYYGQEKPTELTKISDYTSQIVNNEDVNISTIFEIEEGNEIGEYSISIKQNKITVQGNDADNYNVILDKDVKFSVYKYEPDVQAICNEVQDGNFVGVTKATINSPDGFLISEKNDEDGICKQSIDINILETNEGAYTYYLRNNNSLDEEYYKAISEPKIYRYTSVQTIPTVKSIKIEKIEENTTLNSFDYGVIANGKLGVVVYVEGGAVAQDTTIYLVAEEGYYQSKRVDAQQAVFVDNKYTYTQTFELDCNEDQVTFKNLKAYAVNSSGESDKYPTIGTNDTFVDTQTKADKPITIDKANPNVEIKEIDGNYENYAIKASFMVSDLGSGIAKIQYLWDDGFLLNPGDQEYQTDYVEFKDYSIDKSYYELILPWNLSKNVSGDKHTLYLRVTDKAGNIFNISKTDDIGSDMFAPNIESIEIRKSPNNALDSILNFFTFGTFSNKTVEIAVKVNDNESNTNHYNSGVNTVKVNNRIATLNTQTYEYILTLEPENIIDEMQVTVEDNVGLTTSAFATEIPEHGFIKNDNLIVEENDPTIDFGNILNQGHKDNEDRIWFSYDDDKVEMKITVSDNQGQVQSGLYSVTIKDNDEVKYSNSNFEFKTIDCTQTFIIGNLDDGEHIFSVDVVDNCGNRYKDYITFYKDSSPPEKGEISIYSPQSASIDSDFWFDKDDIITFRIQAFDDLSGLKNIQFKINNKVFEYNYSQIKQDQEGYYVLVDTTGIEVDNEHKYNISGKVIDFANNILELDPLTIHKDFENPTIEKFTVENKTNALDKILNILTFGIYSNDSLTLKVYTKDAQFDIGVDYATVTYDGLSEPKIMKNEGNGVFSVEITAEEEVFQSDINIVVYDKYGKSSLTCPNISDVEGNTISDGKFVMIETILPTITINMPASDSVLKTDSKVWYKSNKSIELKVVDEDSGINNVDFFVNGIRIEKDLNDIVLLNTQITESAYERNNDENIYNFDTDYFTSLCGEATNGKYEISAIITDNAGNKTNYKTTYYIDKTSPNIDSIKFVPKTSDGIESTSEFIEKLEYGYYFKTDFSVVVNVSDDNPSSGLYQVNYRFMSYSDGEYKEQISGSKRIIDGKVALDVPKDFKGQIFVEAFDNVLNSLGEITSKAYIVDKVQPDIKINRNADTSYHDAVGNNLYVDTNSFTVVVTDTVSGIKQIGYMQHAEQNPYDRKKIDIDDSIIYKLKDDLGDGWIVTGVDENLVTQVSKTFTFTNDDNDIMLTFDAVDNADNKIENINSEKFTIDKTQPIINISFRDDDDTDVYYNHNRIADITVVERNFDDKLIDIQIQNMFGDVPTYSFVKKSNTVYTTVIEFDEGDYTFDLNGKDLGNNTALVNFSGGNENLFYVDKTIPVIEENFSEFSNYNDNSFNIDKTATIKIIEHNFDTELTNLRVTRKVAGAEHNEDGLEDVTSYVLGGTMWNSSGDTHTISITFDMDAVYYVEIIPSDLASNVADKHNTVIFEIDKTVPVVSMRNDVLVGEDSTEFFDAYPYSRKDDETPTVQFEDLNISHIKYELTTYIPTYSTTDIVVVNPEITTGIVEGDKYTLPDFTDDGVYSIKLIAVDIAGNESALNFSTYARMINQDVLAFIMDSNLERKSGLYSLEYENGNAISKKASSFEDIKIFVMAEKNTPVDIVLRDYDGNSISTNAECTVNNSIYGMQIYNYLIKSDFFKENFQDDTDIELQLTVENLGRRIDLSKIHIDNIAPNFNIPNELTSWHWFYGENDRTLTISHISEIIDEDACKIYDNGKIIPFEYSSIDNTITFTLTKGWHNVGIIVVDAAGNTNNNQEVINIHIGYFWLWFIAISAILIITIVICIIIYNREQKTKKAQNF